ncbi:hypothetical protein BKA64DRAFT_717264 [Cadophora sp. MPI-SDFR-AT-0126]|nr:hypothetical protein BKA64DRAFT_717264 [Leotiomycetes sp. MPI-SDFR-AT-0126]
MSESISQLEREFSTLTTQVKTLEVEILSNLEPRTVCHPCSPHWLSLSPYKRAAGFFEQWEAEREDLMTAPITTHEKATQEDEIMSESQISHLELDASAMTDKTEEELDLLDHARCRTLGALRCYHFNLMMGTLATGDKVDDGVEKSLQKLLELPEEPREDFEISQSMGKSGENVRDNTSDEERMVDILKSYMKQVRTHGVEPTHDIVDVARKILDWAMEHGSTDDEEQHQKAMAWSHWWRWS